MADVRAGTLHALGRAGRHSAGASALDRIVDELVARAKDHVRRVTALELRMLTGASLPPLAAGTVEGLDAEIAGLRERIDGWSGSDNDPLLDDLVAELHQLEAERQSLWESTESLTEKRNRLAALELLSRFVDVTTGVRRLRGEVEALEAAKLDLVKALIDDLDALEGVPAGFSPAIDAMRSRQDAQLDALLADLGIDAGAYAAAIDAMNDGLGPEEAGLAAFLFPPAYLAGVDRASLAELARQLDQARLQVEYQWGIYSGDVGGDGYDTYSVQWELYSAIDRLEELEDTVAAARSEVAWSPLQWAGSAPEMLLPADDRARLLGERLAGSHSPENVIEITRVLERVDGRTSAAFFNGLGVDLVGSLPHFVDYDWQVRREPPGGARPMLTALSEALGRAERTGLLSFGGAALMDTFGGGIHPARLLSYGSFSDRFLLEAAAATVIQGDDDLWSLGINAPDRAFGQWGDPLYWDPREMLLGRVATDPDLSGRLVREMDDLGRLGALLAPEVAHLNDGGQSAGLVLANLGVLAADDRPAGYVLPLVASVVDATARSHRTLDLGVAEGVGLMLLPSMEVFIPFHNTNGFYERDPLFSTDMVVALVERTGSTTSCDTTVRNLLGMLARSGATSLLEAQFALFEAEVITAHFDPIDLSRLDQLADDLGVMKGVFFDTQFDLNLTEARRSDRWNRMLTGTLKGIAGAGSVALTGGAGTLATLGLKRWAVQAILRQSARYGAGELGSGLFPTDRAEGVLEAEIERGRTEEILYDLMAIELLGRLEALDPPWPFSRDGMPYYPDDPGAVQAWFGEVEVFGGEVEIEEVMNTLRVIMVPEHSEIDTGG